MRSQDAKETDIDSSVKMFWCNFFTTKYEIVTAICDENLIGTVIRTDKIDVKISKHFYGGRLIDEQAAIRAMTKATIGNLFGKEIIKLAQKNGFIAKKNIIFIDEIPHAQFVKI